MAEEATLEQEVENETASSVADALAEFEALQAAAEPSKGDEVDTDIDDEDGDEAAAAAAEQTGEDPEQQPGDDDPAEAEAGEGDEVAEEAVVTAPAEGPSFLMKQEAARAGVDPDLAAIATSDAQLQAMIEHVSKSREAAEKIEPVADEPITFDLPEDEFPADDPVRKALAEIATKADAKLEKATKIIGLLAGFANERLEREAMEQQQAQVKEYEQLYSPFDEVLDSFASPVFGAKGKATKEQLEERIAVSRYYQGLGVTADMPAEQKKELALMAATRHRKDVVEQHKQKQHAGAKQAKQVLGGGSGNAKALGPAPTKDDLIRAWDKGLKSGSLPRDL